MDFAVNFKFPHPASDKLGVLGAEIQDQNFFLMGVNHPVWVGGSKFFNKLTNYSGPRGKKQTLGLSLSGAGGPEGRA